MHILFNKLKLINNYHNKKIKNQNLKNLQYQKQNK